MSFIVCTFLFAGICATLYVAFLVTRRRQLHRAQRNLAKKPFNRVAFVIAHPDDESMFFVPTILSLIAEGYPCYLLCLSSGDFMGLGETRKLELLKAASSLGIPDTQVRIVENEKLLDGMQSWSNLQVSSHIAEFVDSFNIDHLITFDERGVSGHRNHIDTFRGVSLFLSTLHPQSRAISAWKLASVSLLRKYIGPLDLLFALFWSLLEPNFIYLNRGGLAASKKAMGLHVTQFVWYRRLFVIFSSYSYFNSLTVINQNASGRKSS